ncbi:hypothetical protein Ahia01_000673800, partial [Argonauta hians]
MLALFTWLAPVLKFSLLYFLSCLLSWFLLISLHLCLVSPAASGPINHHHHHCHHLTLLSHLIVTHLQWLLLKTCILLLLLSRFCLRCVLFPLLQPHHHQHFLLLPRPPPLFSLEPLSQLCAIVLKWSLTSSNARGHGCSRPKYQQCCSCQEASAAEANSRGAGRAETAGVCTVHMRAPQLLMYAGAVQVPLKSSAATAVAVERPSQTAAAAAATTGANSLRLSTASTSSTMLTVQIPQPSPLSRTSPPPLLSPPYPVSTTNLSSSSEAAAAKDAAMVMTAAATTAAAAATTAAANDANSLLVPSLHRSSLRLAAAASSSTQQHLPVSSSSSSVAPLLTTTMMMMMSSPLSSSLRRPTSSVHDWFLSELDARGIESVYSRYIISLLLQRDSDEDGGVGGSGGGVRAAEGVGLSSHVRREPGSVASNHSPAAAKVAPDEPKGTSGVNNPKASLSASVGATPQGRRHRGTSKREKLPPMSEEESKKREAVQCLLEVCDDVQAGGIEKLIEELMLKLKELEEKESTPR